MVVVIIIQTVVTYRKNSVRYDAGTASSGKTRLPGGRANCLYLTITLRTVVSGPVHAISGGERLALSYVVKLVDPARSALGTVHA
jgi:hypothetical protein